VSSWWSDCAHANDFVYAYRVLLAPAKTTLWHRHQQDTIYFSLAETRAKEELPSADAVVTEVPCRAMLSRPHRHDPLIHKVTNAGARHFHMVGAEARRTSPAPRNNPIVADGHKVVLETPRFRVYRITTPPSSSALSYDAYGLLVAMQACTVSGVEGNLDTRLEDGEIRWLEAPNTLVFSSGFEGFFAEWL
jgi:hypothetical protein